MGVTWEASQTGSASGVQRAGDVREGCLEEAARFSEGGKKTIGVRARHFQDTPHLILTVTW